MCDLDWVKPGWFRARGRAQGGVGRKSKQKDSLWREDLNFLVSAEKKKNRREEEQERMSLPIFWILGGKEEKRLWCKEE